jgi:hypothetical protein
LIAPRLDGLLQRVRRLERFVWALGIAAVLGCAAYDARLFGDDLYIVEHFDVLLRSRGLLQTLWVTVLNLDLGPSQYRLYGGSRLLHLGVWSVFGTAAWGYAVFMAAANSASALAIRQVALSLGGRRALANMLAVSWLASPFLTTNCFHHYSYAVLPYQLTAAAALATMRGGPAWLTALLATAIALTGEAHLAFAAVALPLASLARGGGWCAILRRAASPLAMMAVTITAHRLLWREYNPVAGVQRFTLAVPAPATAWRLGEAFAVSLWRGVGDQVVPLVTYSRVSLLLLAAVAVVTIALFARVANGNGGSPWRVAAGGALLVASSLTVLLALSLLSGQVSPSLPRRYGFVPYTLAVMAIVAALWAARRRLTVWPAAAVCSLGVWLYCCLVLSVWPSVNAEDQRVWARVRNALPAGGSALFHAAWDVEATKHDYPYALGMLSLRGPNVPEIVESTLSAYWWEAGYAVVGAGARFAAFKAVDEGNGTVKLFGNDLNDRPPRRVPMSEVLVVSDPRTAPPVWWEPPRVCVHLLGADLSLASP